MHEQIAKLLAEGTGRAWIQDGPLRVYVRCSRRNVNGSLHPSFDIGSVEVEPSQRGKGLFTAWLNELEAQVQTHRVIVFECVGNKKLQKFLRGRGYQIYGYDTEVAPSYMKGLIR